MRPENGRPWLESIGDDVPKAEAALRVAKLIETNHERHRQNLPSVELSGIGGVALATRQDQLPIQLGKNHTKELKHGLQAVVDNGLRIGPLNPEVGREWLQALGVEVEPVGEIKVAQLTLADTASPEMPEKTAA